MRSILPLNLMLRSGGHLPYVLSRLETFANPHDAPSDNTNKRVARSTQGQRERRNALGTFARFAYVHMYQSCARAYVYIYVHIRLVSLMGRGVTALFTYDVPHYRVCALRLRKISTTSLISRRKRAIAFRIGEGNFRSTEKDICSPWSLAVELGFHDVGTFLPFILELNGFSRSS